MLIETKDILHRFSENIEWATSVDLATAWATENKGFDKLKAGAEYLRIHAIVGLWGNITDPKVLKKLDDIGKLRIVDGNQHFHPKIYIFRSSKKSIAWVGSANFTRGGFELNEELIFETSDTKAIEGWFNRLWHQCGRFQEGAIDEYDERRKQNPPKWPIRLRGSIPLLPNGPLELLQGVDDWDGYLNALDCCDQFWSSRIGYSVLGETDSWYDTIQELRVVIKQNWGQIVDGYRKGLLGLKGVNAKWALLGRMRQPAFNTIFMNKRNLKTVQNAIHRVAFADDRDFPDVAIEAYEEITDIKGLKTANATRLMTLARPDYIVSFNGKSQSGLTEYFELSLPEKLSPSKYRSLLDSLYEKPWFNVPPPETPRERNIWSMRAALLDCFVYSGTGPD